MFAEARDLYLANYPRSEANDAVEASELGVDVLFAPPTSEIYPEGFSTTVSVSHGSCTMPWPKAG